MLLFFNWKSNYIDSDLKSLLKHCSDFNEKNTVSTSKKASVFPTLCQIKELHSMGFSVGSQVVSAFGDGAFTGEVSANTLKRIGCEYSLIGHSERRTHLHENGDIIQKKIEQTIAANITPVLCVGESSEDRKSDNYFNFIKSQIDGIIPNNQDNANNDFIIAYEPIWSIGTGVIPTVEQISEMCTFIKDITKATQWSIKVLYGGSVNSSNVESLSKSSNLDGFLIGGASLKFDEVGLILNSFNK